MDIKNEIIGISRNREAGTSLTVLILFKIPFMLLIFGNLIFAVLLFFKIRILADTFDSPNNKLFKSILRGYIVLSLITSLIAFFLILLA